MDCGGQFFSRPLKDYPPSAKDAELMSRFAPLQSFESVNAIISQLRIFGGVTDIQRDLIFHRLKIGHFKKGECIFQQGDQPLYIYIVETGKIDIQINENEVMIPKHRLAVGECFGEASLMSMHAHTATAVAAEESEIVVLSRHTLNQLRHDDIELFALLMMNLARELARRLYLTDKILLEVSAGKQWTD